MEKLLVVLVASTVLVAIALAQTSTLGNFNCLSDSCDSVTCPQINCTYGKLMNTPNSQCSCCQFCLNYIVEDGVCGKTFPDKECGPGLFCTEIIDSTTYYKCLKMNTTCFQALETYNQKKENGTLGMYENRPNCDASGDFVARTCQPGGSCYCVDKNNKRIFGESSPNNATNDADMNCACSRDYETVVENGLLTYMQNGLQQFPHCLPNGNYDSLQCVDQGCFCMNPTTQAITTDLTPITDIQALSCYKPEIHYANYYRQCEVDKIKAQVLSRSYNRQNITVLGLEQPDCTPDGFYKAKRSTDSTYYCADPYGNKIEDFEVDKTSTAASEMNCNCARSRLWMSNQNVAKPLCCKNGNYQQPQCRGGVCFCVDPENGNQDSLEVLANDVASLSCPVVNDC